MTEKNKKNQLLLIVVFFAAILCPLISHADTARMEMLFSRGLEFHQEGDYHRALDLYEQARAVEDDPLITLNIAQIYRRLGQPEDALRELQRYIEITDPDDPFLVGAQEMVPLLEIQAAQARADQRIAAVELLARISVALGAVSVILLLILILRRQK